MNERERIEVIEEQPFLRTALNITDERVEELDVFVNELLNRCEYTHELLHKVWNSDLLNTETCYILYQIGFFFGEIKSMKGVDLAHLNDMVRGNKE